MLCFCLNPLISTTRPSDPVQWYKNCNMMEFYYDQGCWIRYPGSSLAKFSTGDIPAEFFLLGWKPPGHLAGMYLGLPGKGKRLLPHIILEKGPVKRYSSKSFEENVSYSSRNCPSPNSGIQMFPNHRGGRCIRFFLPIHSQIEAGFLLLLWGGLIMHQGQRDIYWNGLAETTSWRRLFSWTGI